MKKIQYGVIGCGEHACRGHIIPANDLGFELVALHDPFPERMSHSAKCGGSNARRYASAVGVLGDPSVEAVIIASPDECHPEQLLSAVKAGKHVLVEKPLAIDAEGFKIVKSALRIAQRDGLVITSCHPRRFDPPYVWVKEDLGTHVNNLGKVVSVRLDFSYHAPSEGWKKSRSLLLDHFPHEIDYLHFLLGKAPFEAFRLNDDFSNYAVAGRRSDGVTFFFSGTRRLPDRIFPERISIRFDQGELSLDTKSGIATIERHGYPASRTRRYPTDYEKRFSLLMKNFAQSIRGKEKNYLSPEDLVVNTESAIALAEIGQYAYRGSR
ncbi:MAG TPA: Gfo/Idh/MocA family oxidoreductase [Candidatus Paceibacterota bacterium]|nr:Gfo/Idh/MocA family oxidoreductase [Candidatus Paceibacterota bacterium]